MSKETTSKSEAQKDPDIILQNNGGFFLSENVAISVMDSKNLDPTEWEPVQKSDKEWFLRRVGSDSPIPEVPEQIFWVRFHESSNPQDTADVPISVNGEQLVFQRGVEIPVPERFLEVADHAVYDDFTTPRGPHEERRIAKKVRVYPYDKLGVATMKDYEKFLSSGRAAQRMESIK